MRLKEQQLKLGEMVKPKVKDNNITYPQKWSAYNLAQSQELDFILKVLDEITCYIPEPKQTRGRPRVPLRDQVIALCIKEYRGLSSRRAQTDIRYAVKSLYLEKPYHFNTLLKFLNNEDLTSVLHQMIRVSSMPLSLIESHASIDSSGFSTSIYERWYNFKYGKNQKIAKFLKGHIISGALTNIIIAGEVTTGNRNDSPELQKLISKSHHYGKIREVSADKAYNSRKNFNIIGDFGAIPLIPFKKHASGLARGSMLYSRMYRYFLNNQEEFLERYHQRSNVETVFSMMKRKLTMQLRTKNFTSQTNEILIKFLVHNLAVLCQEYYENTIGELQFEQLHIN